MNGNFERALEMENHPHCCRSCVDNERTILVKNKRVVKRLQPTPRAVVRTIAQTDSSIGSSRKVRVR